MSWMNVDDGLWGSPETDRLLEVAGRRFSTCISLWTLAGSRAACYGTGGLVPRDKLVRGVPWISERAAREAAQCLVEAGWWVEVEDEELGPCYQFCDWEHCFNLPRKRRPKKTRSGSPRSSSAERTRRYRERLRAERGRTRPSDAPAAVVDQGREGAVLADAGTAVEASHRPSHAFSGASQLGVTPGVTCDASLARARDPLHATPLHVTPRVCDTRASVTSHGDGDRDLVTRDNLQRIAQAYEETGKSLDHAWRAMPLTRGREIADGLRAIGLDPGTDAGVEQAIHAVSVCAAQVRVKASEGNWGALGIYRRLWRAKGVLREALSHSSPEQAAREAAHYQRSDKPPERNYFGGWILHE